MISGSAGGPGYNAQNNTQSVITDADTVARFTTELIAEPMAAQHLAVNDPTKVSSLKGPTEGTVPPAKAKATATKTASAKKTPAKSGGKG